MNKYYQITTEKATYNCVINNSNNQLFAYIGGEKYTCLELVYSLDIKKHTQCFINAKEKVIANDMMYALLYLLKEKHQSLCTIELTDMSQNEIMGNLSSYYLAFYQETWYERDFCAYLKDEKVRNRYIKNKEIFGKKEKSNDYMENFLYKKLDEDNIKIIVDIYNHSVSYKDFFKNLKTKIPANRLGILIKPWLDDFIKFELQFRMINMETWVIKCEPDVYCNENMKLKEKFIINELKSDPYNGIYTNIEKLIQKEKQQMGSGNLIHLSQRQRESFKNPIWIGWLDLDLNKYSEEDSIYLKKLISTFT